MFLPDIFASAAATSLSEAFLTDREIRECPFWLYPGLLLCCSSMCCVKDSADKDPAEIPASADFASAIASRKVKPVIINLETKNV